MTEELVQPMGFGKRLLGVFFSPVETFRDIAERPKFLVVLLLQLAVTLILTFLLRDKTWELSLAILQKTGQSYSAEQLASMKVITLITGLASSLIVIPIIILVIAGLLKFFSQFTLGEGSFKAVFSAVTWSMLPTMLGGIITSVLAMFATAQEMMRISTSLALFYSSGATTSFAYQFLSRIDFFTIWSLVLMAIGGGLALKQSPKKVGGFLFVLWLIYAVGVSALGSIFGGQAGMG
ncbi:MAG: YIP1 family protein [Firmicutes bacterium]|nr:YIP1 family protein [Bacillota bacterium]